VQPAHGPGVEEVVEGVQLLLRDLEVREHARSSEVGAAHLDLHDADGGRRG
jgi:hypothetical protein